MDASDFVTRNDLVNMIIASLSYEFFGAVSTIPIAAL